MDEKVRNVLISQIVVVLCQEEKRVGEVMVSWKQESHSWNHEKENLVCEVVLLVPTGGRSVISHWQLAVPGYGVINVAQHETICFI